MARPRKQKYDPRQHSFMFDIMADQIEHIRVENIQANLEQPKVVLQDSSPPYVRLGLNNNGVAVYTLKEGGRMVSRDPAIMQTVDGDKDTRSLLHQRQGTIPDGGRTRGIHQRTTTYKGGATWLSTDRQPRK